MSTKEEKIKVGLGIFCSVCILTMVFLLTNTNPEELLTSFERIEKTAHVEFSGVKGRGQVLYVPENVLYSRNISVHDTTVEDYKVKFNNESGKVEYTFAINNKSNSPAVIEEYALPNPVCHGFHEDCVKVLSGLKYKLEYEYGGELRAGDIIEGRETKNVTLTIEYNANKNDLPSASTEITNLGFKLIFKGK